MIYRLPNINALIEMHNQLRNQSWPFKKKPLKQNDKLMMYAQQWTEHMSFMNKLEHSKIKHMIALGFKYAGENIACGYDTEQEVMNSWLSSYEHKNNIMNKNYTDIGCSFSYARNDTIYWCVCFGKK